MFTNIIKLMEIKQQKLVKFVLDVEKVFLCQNIKIGERVENVALQNFYNS